MWLTALIWSYDLALFSNVVNCLLCTYCIYYKYKNRHALANCVDPDQMTQNVAYDQGLLCLSLILQFNPCLAEPGYTLLLQIL